MSTVEQDKELYLRFRKSPILFIKKMWGLVPQPLKPEFINVANRSPLVEYRKGWFQPFEKGKHIAWQQWIILLAVEKAIRGEATKRISVRSGRGIGKTTTMAWLVLWYLFCHKNAQIPCTAPTAPQLNDVLWKEMSLWLNKMPKKFADDYLWQASYIRMSPSPETWFARAKTARKENPEALAGAHGKYVMLLGDEASGIADTIFKIAEGSLTDKDFFFILISNPRRLSGYFYATHHKDKPNWQALAFNAEDSPIVDQQFVDRIIQKYGKDSDEYRVEVMGEFPNAEMMDEKGYVPLLAEKDINIGTDTGFVGKKTMGIDPAGSGKNKTAWGVRDVFKFKMIAREAISVPKSIAQKSLTLMEHFKVKDEDIYLDNFGSGANVAKEMAIADGSSINPVNVGDPAEDNDKFLNKRAECYWRIKDFFRGGGEVVGDTAKLKEQLLSIKYRKTLSGKIQIMSKKEMAREGIPSPDEADTFSLTFYEKDVEERKKFKQKKREDPFKNG